MATMPVGIEVESTVKQEVFIDIGYQLGMAIETACKEANNSSLPMELIIEKDGTKIIFRVNH
jgi:hypothetical protein